MFLADYLGRKDTRGRIQWVNSRINALGGDITAQNRGGIQVGKGSGGRRVCQVVSGHVDGLHRRDGPLYGWM